MLRVSNDFQTSLYADDTAIFCKSKKVNDLESKLQNQCDLISNWIDLHTDKIKGMIFGLKNKSCNRALNEYIKNERIEFFIHFKSYLGHKT